MTRRQDDEKHASILIEFPDKRRGIHLLEVLPDEAQGFAEKGRKVTKEELVEMGLLG